VVELVDLHLREVRKLALEVCAKEDDLLLAELKGAELLAFDAHVGTQLEHLPFLFLASLCLHV